MAIRQVTRNTTALFDRRFVAPDNTPLTPLNLNYPQVSIIDPDGTLLSQGSAEATDDEGRYRYSWFTPVDATLSSPTRPYTVQWNFVTSNNRQYEYQDTFAVIDSVDFSPQERGYTYLTMQGKSERVMARFRQPQAELTLTLIDPGQETQSYSLVGGDFTEVNDQGQYVYYVDSPALGKVGSYLAVWESRASQISPAVNSVQQIRVPEMRFWELAPSLRMLLDKSQKKVGFVQAYADSDLHEYLSQGMQYVNSVNPITAWSLNGFPAAYGVGNYVLLAAAHWGLMAQYLSETELAFEYSGASTTLSVDRSAAYDGLRAAIEQQLETGLQRTKRNIMRSASSGSFAGRPYNLGMSNIVTRIQSTKGNATILPLLSSIGLI